MGIDRDELVFWVFTMEGDKLSRSYVAPPKSWVQSRTVWSHVATIVLAWSGAISAYLLLMPELQAYPVVLAILKTVEDVSKIWLRFDTRQPIK